MMTAARRLRIAPHAAEVAIAAEPELEGPYRITWRGAAATVRENGAGIDVRYTLGARLRAASTRRAALEVLLSPAVVWSIELAGGVSGLRADLSGLEIAAFAVTGGASDLRLDDARLGSVGGAVHKELAGAAGAAPLAVHVRGGAHGLALATRP